MSERKLTEAEKKRRKREGSDAKWRADQRICYNLLRKICPSNELEQRQRKSGVITRLGSLEKASEKIPQLEQIISHILAEKSKKTGAVDTLEHVRHSFSSLAGQVRRWQLESSRSRLFTTHPAAQPICTAGVSQSDDTLDSLCCAHYTSSGTSMAESYTSSEVSSSDLSSENLPPDVDIKEEVEEGVACCLHDGKEQSTGYTHELPRELADKLADEERFLNFMAASDESDDSEADSTDDSPNLTTSAGAAKNIEQVHLNEYCEHSLTPIIGAEALSSLADDISFDDEYALLKMARLLQLKEAEEMRVPDLHQCCMDNIHVDTEMYESEESKLLDRESNPPMDLNAREAEVMDSALSDLNSAPDMVEVNEDGIVSLRWNIEEGEMEAHSLLVKMEP